MATDRSRMITPTALLIALYAEYDGLLNSRESVRSQMKSQDCSNEVIRVELRRKAHEIYEALADVHEKIADSLRRNARRWVSGYVTRASVVRGLNGSVLVSIFPAFFDQRAGAALQVPHTFAGRLSSLNSSNFRI